MLHKIKFKLNTALLLCYVAVPKLQRRTLTALKGS